jgi:hypothetical protein
MNANTIIIDKDEAQDIATETAYDMERARAKGEDMDASLLYDGLNALDALIAAATIDTVIIPETNDAWVIVRDRTP